MVAHTCNLALGRLKQYDYLDLKGSLQHGGAKTKSKQEHKYFGICAFCQLNFPAFFKIYSSKGLKLEIQTHNSNPSHHVTLAADYCKAPVS